jgi:hypothetical protein
MTFDQQSHLPTIRSAVLCLAAPLPPAAPKPQPSIDLPCEEFYYHDNGEWLGFRAYRRLPLNAHGVPKYVTGIFSRVVSHDIPWHVHVRITLEPTCIPDLFASEERKEWRQFVSSTLNAATEHAANWKDRFGTLLIIETADVPHETFDEAELRHRARHWLEFLGIANTIARPFAVGDTVFTVAPQIVRTTRATCALTRRIPDDIATGELALNITLDYLMQCWIHAIHIDDIRADIKASLLYRETLIDYLNRIGWHSKRSQRQLHYRSTSSKIERRQSKRA